ncbi:MAG: hypothetical protein ACLT1B_02785 [Anaerobutyricum hallii]
MNKIVKAVKEGQEIETKDLFNVVNDFYLTRLRVSKDGGECRVYASKRVRRTRRGI